ncbi:MAG TPA: putative porin [Verrucomicrobiae bacterium]|nr:putative porin [Verrucomicrobiae bacterium]
MFKPHKINRWILTGTGALIAASATAAFAADSVDSLLDALVKKGVLTQKEATDIKEENTTNIAVLPASKWKISDAIKSIGLFGDVRFRYEYRSADNPQKDGLTTGDTYYRERFRYALRAGIRGDLYDNWSYGIRIETSANPRSPWVTFADDTGKANSGGVSGASPSDKTSDFLNVGQVYLNWHPADWYEMTVGRMPMPLYTTPMVWDSDINPEGAFEKLKYSIGPVDTFMDFAQFDYQNVSPDHQFPSADTFILAWQMGAIVNVHTNEAFKIAPVVYNYTGHGASAGLNTPFVGQGNLVGGNPNTPAALNQDGINDLLVLEVPAEFTFPIPANPVTGPLEGRLFGDFAYNFNGADRARAAFAAGGGNTATNGFFPGVSGPATGENKAYQIGLGIGNRGPVYGPTQGLVYGTTSKKGTWEVRAYWQHIEQYSLDVNLIDSDFFEGRANLQGFYTAASYSFTDGIIGTLRYGHASRINSNLGTGGSNLDLPQINPINNYNLFQADLTWRF